MEVLNKQLVETLVRELQPNNVLDVGCSKSEYLPFLFSHIGVVYGIDIRLPNTKNSGFYIHYDGNYRYFPDRINYDLLLCTDYLEYAGVSLYSLIDDDVLGEQRMLLDKMVAQCNKGVLVTIPFAKTDPLPRCQQGKHIFYSDTIEELVVHLESSCYNIRYYNGIEPISPQVAMQIVYPQLATCAIEIIKRGYGYAIRNG